MLDIIGSTWSLFVGLLAAIWGVLVLVATWGWEVLYHLHVTTPRLEGLLVGILLTWLFMRREKHPALRVLSAPLKLVLDILDLAWDWGVEVVVDAWEAVAGATSKAVGTVTGALRAAGGWVMAKLTGLRDSLKKSDQA